MSLRWRGGGGASGGNVLAQRFPSFQFDAEDVLSGRVKVFARSPSGRMQPMNVLDADGQFNANFTPDEVGTCPVMSCDFVHTGCVSVRRVAVCGKNDATCRASQLVRCEHSHWIPCM